MLYLNDQFHFFSIEGLQAILSPPVYRADGIRDFLENKESIVPTPFWKALINGNPKLKDKAFILFGPCTYEEIYPASKIKKRILEAKIEFYFGLFESRIKAIEELSTSMPNIDPNSQSQILYNQFIKNVCNARIYDSTGEILAITNLTPKQGSYHSGASIMYDTKTKAITLLELTEDIRGIRKPKKIFTLDLSPIPQPI